MYQTISQPKIWFALVSTILLHILAMVCLSFAPALQLKPMASKPISIKFVTPPKQEQVIEQPKVTEEVPPVIEKKEPKEIPIPKPKKTITPPKNEPKPKPKEKPKPIQKPQTKLLNTQAEAEAKQREIDRQNEIKKQQEELVKQQRLEQERLQREREQAEKEMAEQEEKERLEREKQAREEQQRQEAERAEAKRKADEAQKAKKQADAKRKKQAGQTITARYSYEAPAKYPNKEQKRGRNGSVSFSFIIGTNGKAKNIQVTNSSSNAFKKSALKALKSSKFHVTKIDGVAVEQKAKKTIIFELN